MKNNPSKYKYGLFYWNPDDQRIWVPKLMGWGWTLNFANPLSYIFLIIIFLLVFYLAAYN